MSEPLSKWLTHSWTGSSVGTRNQTHRPRAYGIFEIFMIRGHYCPETAKWTNRRCSRSPSSDPRERYSVWTGSRSHYPLVVISWIICLTPPSRRVSVGLCILRNQKARWTRKQIEEDNARPKGSHHCTGFILLNLLNRMGDLFIVYDRPS